MGSRGFGVEVDYGSVALFLYTGGGGGGGGWGSNYEAAVGVDAC